MRVEQVLGRKRAAARALISVGLELHAVLLVNHAVDGRPANACMPARAASLFACARLDRMIEQTVNKRKPGQQAKT
jgi:hypothetical protein